MNTRELAEKIVDCLSDGYDDEENRDENNCDEILTVKEVSQYLKVNVHKVYELINDGLLPAFKLGSLKVSRKSLEEFVKSCENDFST